MLIPVYAEGSAGQVLLERAVFVPERSGSLLSRVENPEVRLIVLEAERVRLPDWEPGDEYLGVRILEDGAIVSRSHKGDVLILRRAPALPLIPSNPNHSQTGIQLSGGQVAFLSEPSLTRLAGIPQALLRGLDHD
jgi:hypothetical protein